MGTIAKLINRHRSMASGEATGTLVLNCKLEGEEVPLQLTISETATFKMLSCAVAASLNGENVTDAAATQEQAQNLQDMEASNAELVKDLADHKVLQEGKNKDKKMRATDKTCLDYWNGIREKMFIAEDVADLET